MVGWHHQLNGHEFKQTPGDSEGQGSLTCCSPWGLSKQSSIIYPCQLFCPLESSLMTTYYGKEFNIGLIHSGSLLDIHSLNEMIQLEKYLNKCSYCMNPEDNIMRKVQLVCFFLSVVQSHQHYLLICKGTFTSAFYMNHKPQSPYTKPVQEASVEII